MSIHDAAELPVSISFGSAGAIGWDSRIVENSAGFSARRPRMTYGPSLRSYSAVLSVLSAADVATLQAFARCRRGSAHAFRFVDWRDHTNHQDGESDGSADGDRIQIGVGDGSRVVWQIVKPYTDADGTTVTREITRPTVGTVQVWVDSLARTEGSHYAVDYDTGRIVFKTPPAAGQDIDVAFQFAVPARIGTRSDDWLEVVAIARINDDRATLDVVEIVDQLERVEDHPAGALLVDPLDTEKRLEFSDGALQQFRPVVGGYCILWDPADNTPEGGPMVTLHNTSTTRTMVVIDIALANVATLTPGQAVTFYWSGADWLLY